MRSRLRFLVLFLTLAGCQRQCHHNDEPAPDPCIGIRPVSARMSFYTYINPVYDTLWDKSFSSDTVAFNSINFIAPDTNIASYSWKIGGQTFNTPHVYRDNIPYRTQIPIQLVVHRKPAPDGCLMPFEMKDSVVRNLFCIQPRIDTPSTLMSGRFRGYRNGNPQDTATLTFLIDTVSIRLSQAGSLTFGNFWPGEYFCWWNSTACQLQYRQVAFGDRELNEQRLRDRQGVYWTVNDTLAIALYGRGIRRYDGTVEFRYWAARQVAAVPWEFYGTLKKNEYRYFTFTGRKIEGI